MLYTEITTVKSVTLFSVGIYWEFLVLNRDGKYRNHYALKALCDKKNLHAYLQQHLLLLLNCHKICCYLIKFSL
jgi:hypothetical protein